MINSCSVFFSAKNCDLKKAIAYLEKYNFSVIKQDEKVTVSKNDDMQFDIYLVEDESVVDDAMGVSKGTRFQAVMSRCTARFDIVIEDLDKALDEINTLMEVQGALQDASKGYLYTPWNGNILEPWVK